jgi:hypothetical protein
LAGRTAARSILGGLHHQYIRRLTTHIVRFYRLPAEAAVRVAPVEGWSLARSRNQRKRRDDQALQIVGIDDLQRRLTMSQVGVRTAVTLIRGSEQMMLAIEPIESPRK